MSNEFATIGLSTEPAGFGYSSTDNLSFLSSLLENAPASLARLALTSTLALSSATAIADPWTDRRKIQEGITMIGVYDLPVGRPVSRAEALRIAQDILETAERERCEFVEWEASRGLRWEDEE